MAQGQGEILAEAMSQENVEIVRRSTKAYNRGALDEALASWATDAVLDWSNSRGLEPAVIRGRGEIHAYMERFLEMFEEVKVELRDIWEVDEDVLIAETIAHLRGRDGIRVTARSTWLIILRNGRQTSLTMYQSKAEALEAARLAQ
jgi:ketosteroid isomerase-like protein